MFTGAVVVGTVAIAGHTVVKTGEVAVKAVTGGGKKASSTAKSTSNSIVISRNRLDTQTQYSVPALKKAADRAIDGLGFKPISSSGDAMSAAVRGKMASGQTVIMYFELVKEGLTKVSIQITPDGKLKQVEFIYDKILAAIEV